MYVKRVSIVAILSLLFILTIPPLSQTAHATTIDFTNFNAVMSTSVDPRTGNEVLSLLVDSSLYGPGGFAGGLYQFQGTATVERGIWVAMPPDPVIPPPDDQMPAISFLLDADGNIVDIQPPDPFRLFLATPSPDDTMPGAVPTLIGELDFSYVTGYRGSLHLSGLQVLAVDSAGVPTGTVYAVSPFTIQPVPEPSTLLLMVFGLTGLIGVRKWVER